MRRTSLRGLFALLDLSSTQENAKIAWPDISIKKIMQLNMKRYFRKKQYHISMTMSTLNGLTALSWIKIRLNIIIKTKHRYAKIRSSIYEDCYVCEIFFNIRFLTNLFLLSQNYLLIDKNKLILTIFFIFVSV